MMRAMAMAVLPFVVTCGLSACSEAPPPVGSEDPPILLKGGQWAMTVKTTSYHSPTVTPAQAQTALATVMEEKVCVTVDGAGIPGADALSGGDGKDCSYKDQMLRKGRIIATLACRSGAGTSEIAVEGNYTAETLTVSSNMMKTQGGQPIMNASRTLTGKRVGDCPKV